MRQDGEPGMFEAGCGPKGVNTSHPNSVSYFNQCYT
jgi:hypothetical protein